MTDTLAILRAGVARAVARHAVRQKRVAAMMSKWATRRSECCDAARTLTQHDPARRHAELMAQASAWRLMAWQSIALGYADTAWKSRRQATHYFAQAIAARARA